MRQQQKKKMVSSSLADFVNERAESVFRIFFFFFDNPSQLIVDLILCLIEKKLLYFNLILNKSKYFFLD